MKIPAPASNLTKKSEHPPSESQIMCPQFKKDTLFSMPMNELVDFSFDENTVSVFPDMINRSVPGYSLMQSLTGLVASVKVSQGSRVYDLGCSLGASSMAVLNSVAHQDYELILVDQSKPMILKAQHLLNNSLKKVPTQFLYCDLRDVEIENASLVLLNLVLQFLPPGKRQACIDGIYNGLDENGALLISEKIHSQAQDDQVIVDQLYTDFKKRSGYSELEISQKRQALENVLRPESIDAHRRRLEKAGFSTVLTLMQALNFATLLAIK